MTRKVNAARHSESVLRLWLAAAEGGRKLPQAEPVLIMHVNHPMSTAYILDKNPR